MKESKHFPLDQAKERIKNLYPDNDGDLLNDNIELNQTFTNTSDPDSDDDFFPDGAEFDYWNEMYDLYHNEDLLPVGDLDGDGQSNIVDPDSDSDGVPDGWEIENDLTPWRGDSDHNGEPDRFEFYIYYNFETLPTRDDDNDQLPDYWENFFKVSDPEDDPDNDGVNNINEWYNGSDPTYKDERYGFEHQENETQDRDEDGLSDRLEVAIGLNPNNPDTDNDSLFDNEEFQYWSLPFIDDTDEDNLTDGFEVFTGSGPHMIDSDRDKLPDIAELITDPSIPDTNKNLVLDGDEYYANDIDRDGLPNLVELDNSDGFTTDPFDPDCDGDGLKDGEEDSNRNGRRDGNDPTDRDSDWNSGGETDPNNWDTDGGGLSDDFEILINFDPLDPSDDGDFDLNIEPPEPPEVEPDPPEFTWNFNIDPTICLTWIGVIVIIILVLVVIYYFTRRKKKLIDEIIDILAAGESKLYTLDTGDEIRNTIFRTYQEFLNALTKYDLKRRKSMTVQEFAKVVGNKLPIRPAPVNRLTDVFEEARYSNHKLGTPTRDRAVQSFHEVRQDLLSYKGGYSIAKDSGAKIGPANKLFHKIKHRVSLKGNKS